MFKIIFYLFTYKISNNYIKYVKLCDLKNNDNDIYNNINNDINNIMNNSNNNTTNITSVFNKNMLSIKTNKLNNEIYRNLYAGIDQTKEYYHYNPSNNSYINNFNNTLSEYNLTDKINYKNSVNLYKKNLLDKLTSSNINIIDKLNYIDEYRRYFCNDIKSYNIHNNLTNDWNIDF